jgi:hypothetical protein
VSLLQAAGPLKAQCPKFAALFASTGYGRIRAKLPNEKVYVYDLLEDSVDSDVCANCLSADCDWNTCTPPVENFLFQESTKLFFNNISNCSDIVVGQFSNTKTVPFFSNILLVLV